MKHIDLSLSKIVDNVLNEDIVRRKKKYSSDIDGKINKVIDRKILATFYYDDRKGDKDAKKDENGNYLFGNPRGIRKVLVFAYYKSKQNGEDTIRGFHWSDRHTKRGPHLWKEFIVKKIKYFRPAPKDHYTDDDVPNDANWKGDDHAKELYNIVKRGEPRYYEDEFVTPAEREKERMSNDEKGYSSDYLYTNQQGPVEQPKTPDIKKGRNLKTMQNLGKPGNIDYKKAYDAFKQSDAKNTFNDWDKAEAERKDQETQRQRGAEPPQNTPGPIKQPQKTDVNNDENEEEDWDEWMKRTNNLNNLKKLKDTQWR